MRRPARLSITAIAATVALIGATTASFAHPTHDCSDKEAGFDRVAEDVSPGGVPQERMTNIRCKGKKAGIFPCHKVDLTSLCRSRSSARGVVRR